MQDSQRLGRGSLPGELRGPAATRHAKTGPQYFIGQQADQPVPDRRDVDRIDDQRRAPDDLRQRRAVGHQGRNAAGQRFENGHAESLVQGR